MSLVILGVGGRQISRFEGGWPGWGCESDVFWVALVVGCRYLKSHPSLWGPMAPAGPRRAQGLGSADEEGLGTPRLSRVSYLLGVYGPRKVGGAPSGFPAKVPRVCEVRPRARRAASRKVPEVCEASVARCPRRAFHEGFPKVCEVWCVEKSF